MPIHMPGLFGAIPLREILLPYPRQTIRLLAIEDPWSHASTFQHSPDADIFWSELWPSAVALAAVLLERDILLPDSNAPILEIGCGTGLVSIAAAHAFPQARFIAADKESSGVRLAAENARRNGVADRIETATIDWRSPGLQRHAAVFAADCLYHEEACAELARFIDCTLEKRRGAKAWVADPIRHSARHFSLRAQEAGFAVERKNIPVPFLLDRGPVYRFGPPETKPYEALEVHLYELSRTSD